MNQVDDLHVDNWLRQTAAEFPYPQTPDVRQAVRRRIQPQSGPPAKTPAPSRRLPRLAPMWALLTVILLAASLLLVPQVRAAVIQLLRAGGITIFVAEPTPHPAVTPADDPRAAAPPATATIPSRSPTASPPSFLVPVTPVSLADAAEALDATSALPTSLSPYGAPHEVYVDDEDEAQVVILLWFAAEERRYLLYVIAARDFATKQVNELQTTTVDEHEAFWIEGPHGFILQGGDLWDTQTASGAVLIWSDGDLTYRLEGASSMEEARQLAEALNP